MRVLFGRSGMVAALVAILTVIGLSMVDLGQQALASGSTGRLTAAVVAKRARRVDGKPERKARVRVEFENANEAAEPGQSYTIRLFRKRSASGTMRGLGRLSTTLDAGDSISFTSRRIRFVGQATVRGEVWSGDTLVASRKMELGGSGEFEMRLVWGQFDPDDDPNNTQGGLRLRNSISGINFSKVMLSDPTSGVILFEYTFVPSSASDSPSLSFGEVSALINAPLGTFRVSMRTTEATPRDFVFDQLATFGSSVVELDARIQ